MAEMGSASITEDLGSSHESAFVYFGPDPLRGERLPEAGPSCSRVELGVGAEEGISAADTLIGTALLAIVIGSSKSPLRSFFTGDSVLLRRQPLFPFLVGFHIVVGHNPSSPPVTTRHKPPAPRRPGRARSSRVSGGSHRRF